ncbi:MAG: hypothetical protein AAB521_05030 [Patescibacteria group bacterium]
MDKTDKHTDSLYIGALIMFIAYIMGGAFLQEAIDVAVIINALRASR